MGFKKVALSIALVAVMVLSLAPAHALTLTDGNSTATTNSSGMSSWVVNGISMLFQQSFYYRLDGDTTATSVGALSLSTNQLSPRIAELTWSGTGFTIDVTYTLTGGAVGQTTSDIAESIRITNTGGAPLAFNFFQYSDFDLGGSPNDTVQLVNSNAVRQFDPNFALSETVVTPAPNFYQIGACCGLNLNGAGNLQNGATSFGPGDATWAFQWQTTIGAGQSFLISKDKNIAPVPEPASVLLLGSGLVGVGLWGMKRRKSA